MAFFLTIFSPNIDSSVTITNIAIEPTAIGSPRYWFPSRPPVAIVAAVAAIVVIMIEKSMAGVKNFDFEPKASLDHKS